MKRFIKNDRAEERLRPINWASEISVLAQRYGERIAVSDRHGTLTYAELMSRATAIAQALAEHGIGPGQTVATIFRNDRNAVSAMLGVMMAGATEVPLNPALSHGDRQHCCAVARVETILSVAELSDANLGQLSNLILVDHIEPAQTRWTEDGHIEPEAPSRIVFTSGTTGKPKGAVHSHRGRWLANLLLRASLPHRPGANSRILLMTPFSHGTSLMTYAYLCSGASVELRDGVHPESVLPLLEQGVCDSMFAPPTVLAKIVDAAEGRRITTLRTIFCGTAVLKPTLYARAREVFGPIIRVTYGKSEIFNPICVMEPDETDDWYSRGSGDACVGWPAPGVEIAIHDVDGQPVTGSQTGEVMIRSLHLMAGYRTTQGFQPLRADGFHDTGDLGYVDEVGRLHLTGRIADVIKSGGYKISPEEIERELGPALGHSEVAVVGIPSEYWGEVVLAAIERPPDDWQERLSPVLAAMTGYKRPRLFITVEELPRNGIGKIVRSRIREFSLANYTFRDGPHPRLEPEAASSINTRIDLG
ncbi:class I adenylate-forming enzyme family protein [Bosea thiooxidans]|nr:class I adenylate-forming enzyme family protein [Bosea sp. (in: a-proteobacteria)]